MEVAHNHTTPYKTAQGEFGYIQGLIPEEQTNKAKELQRVRFSSPVVQRIYTYRQQENGTSIQGDVVFDSSANEKLNIGRGPEALEGIQNRILSLAEHKGLQPLPPHIKRDTEIKGKFAFRRGIRIRDYRQLKASMTTSPPVCEMQCRDGFKEHEIWHGRPRLFPQLRSTTDVLPPPIPRRETKQLTSSKGYVAKRRVAYDPVKDIETMRLPPIGQLELMIPIDEAGRDEGHRKAP